ncbi:SpoIIIAH-like family protein [Anaerotignum propionicum]|jgi:stage III sporulation protein AH|uniref:SpoIIIAH-like protein n=1 Tax=Anaerotignum propionicum DSM 1682 TaxID=991789 RepID=A0A110A760_ANAPI|nr:SpoIIIAH-like family protein [Anaerotignum propionicum]AMJ41647.1 SpoIIIAH-like protein [Anaerotignum propionicum DSM 1682]MEA5057335.1 SpoIIIAH-like family protein [Anaerotignum propionicum]SHE88214.1 stage III sporulation protein AH [[Clostridium] propionicum DSM 1682] [Anaerotignum propionicum DSM 1682]HBF65446.1 SpoIIIAH-like family protein [Clostridium sp.]
MFVIKRNQVVVTALAVMIAAAGYLNFQDSKASQQTKTALQLTEEGDASAAIKDYDTLPDDISANEIGLDPITAEASNTTGDGAAVFVSADATLAGSQFFAEAKLDREQARAKQKDILTEMMNNENVSQSQKDKCGDSMLQLQERIEKETAAEAMIEAKGFTEAYVRIDDQTVDVVVDKATLSDSEVAQIEDIVKRKTGFKADQIRINPLKK